MHAIYTCVVSCDNATLVLLLLFYEQSFPFTLRVFNGQNNYLQVDIGQLVYYHLHNVLNVKINSSHLCY